MTYNFTTDIEERNPWTGNVYYISRMTSDWAERHPLNVGDVIEGVYREFEGTEFEESREELRRVWTAVLAVSSPQGDASLYPNRGGRRRAAAMKVWLLAGDYWRRGFRTGDTLPAMVPGCRITRIGGDGRAIERYSLADRPGTAWIALFPKDLHLLGDAPAEVADAPTLEGHTDITDSTDSFEAVQTTPDPSYSGGEAAAEVDPSSIDPRDEEIAALRARIAELEAQASPVIESVGNQAAETTSPCQASDTEGTGTSVPSADDGTARMEPVPAVPRSQREILAERRHQRRLERERMQRSYEERMEREAREAEEYARQQERRKIFAAVGAAAVTLVMIYFFGLLGPAVFGLLAGGLLKG